MVMMVTVVMMVMLVMVMVIGGVSDDLPLTAMPQPHWGLHLLHAHRTLHSERPLQTAVYLGLHLSQALTELFPHVPHLSLQIFLDLEDLSLRERTASPSQSLGLEANTSSSKRSMSTSRVNLSSFSSRSSSSILLWERNPGDPQPCPGWW